MIHLEFADGETADLDVPDAAAQGTWDGIMDGGLGGRTDIAYALWTRPGKTRPLVAGIYGIPAAGRAPAPDPEAAAGRRAELDAVAAVNDAGDRRDNRREYYLRTGR
jgi:hypothetical protein